MKAIHYIRLHSNMSHQVHYISKVLNILGFIKVGNEPRVYLVVDTDIPPKPINIRCIGTGLQFDQELEKENQLYIGTWVDENLMVWHYFIENNGMATDDITLPVRT